MDRCPPYGAPRRARAAVVLVALGTLALSACDGQGAGGTAADATAETSGPVTQSTSLPADWPTGLTFPDGATITYTTADDTGMSVLFSAPQDLSGLRTWFDEVATGLGYQRKTDDSFVDMLSTSWSDGDVTISVTATPVADRTSGLLLVQPEE